MAIQSTIMLNNGTVIPQVGLGVFQTPDGDTTVNAVQTALENGYRHIDTAMIYRNEASVGEGIRRAGVPRSDFFLTTKLWNDDIRARRGKDAFQESLDRLGVDYVDLYLIHWPADGWQQAWDDLQEIYASGRAKAIGVSNFQKHHIDELLTHSDVVPAVDQVESSPQFTNQELIVQLRAKGIATEAWSPLGGTGGNLLSTGRNRCQVRQVCCTGSDSLAHPARYHRAAQVHSCRAYQAELRGLRLQPIGR